MNRPYVICHILSSLDGKINGPFMEAEAVRGLSAEYGRLRAEKNADAWLYGTTTTKEFTNFKKPEPWEDAGTKAPEGDFIADGQADLYYVSVDTKGEIGWDSGTFRYRGMTPMHVIEVLTESTPAAYKNDLRNRGVSYIIAGGKELDCRVAMEKLYALFSIRKLLICGGGLVNWSFLQAGMIDELSLLLAPVTDGGSGAASLFARIPSLTQKKAVEFVLQEAQRMGEGGIYLNYLAKNAEKEA